MRTKPGTKLKKLGKQIIKNKDESGLSLPFNKALSFDYQPFIFSLGAEIRLNSIFDE